MIKYMEARGLRVVPVYEGLRPIEHLVVNTEGKTVANFKMLYEAEVYIMHSKKERGITVGSAAELRSY